MFEDVVSGVLDRGAGTAAGASRFSCAVTGGSTGLIFLGALRDAAVPWSQVTLYFGDERAVPPDHAESNYALAERLLLAPLGAGAPSVERMKGEEPDLDAAARDYESHLPPAMDLIILGIGDDGHVCSLFPGHPALAIEDRRVIAIQDSPKPPPQRLTLTLPYVCASPNVWVVAIGSRKQPVLQAAAAGHSSATPLDLVLRRARNVTVFTDQALRR
jgi:6-phosphogluconolactonase